MAFESRAVTLRMLERSLIVLGGILSVFLGYRLFVLGIDNTQGEAIAFGIELRNFGPGLFFAALGAVVLVTSMRAAIRTGAESAVQPASEPVRDQRVKQRTKRAVFFGIEDPSRNLKQWSATSFFLETRDLLRRLEQGDAPDKLLDTRRSLQDKLDSITMTQQEYERYQVLTNKVPLTADEQKEYEKLETRLFP